MKKPIIEVRPYIQNGLIRIPKGVTGYLYPPMDDKTGAETMIAHARLAKFCLVGIFLIDEYWLPEGGTFVPVRSDETRVKLTHRGELVIGRPRRPSHGEAGEWRPFYVNVAAVDPLRALPDGAAVQIRNVNTLAKVFAKIHDVRDINDIPRVAAELRDRPDRRTS